MASLYALPLPHFRQRTTVYRDDPRSRKRKRSQSRQSEAASQSAEETSKYEDEGDRTNEEYLAVLDPEERSQRRVAHYSLLKDLPASPFPHKDTTQTRSRKAREVNKAGEDDQLDADQSLRVQHISVMTAILHRSVQSKDWTRARRALGLLLRTEISGHPIDIRAADLWGIGAEIIFRQHPDPGKTYSINGFRMAKDYYDKLVVRYPYDRNYPDSVNSVDFYLAMFSLWIYVTQAERVARQDDLNDDSLHDALKEELHEADEILGRLRRITTQMPYSDNDDLKKLKVDVELWRSHLLRDQQLYSPTAVADNGHESEQKLSLRPASFQSTVTD